MKSALKSPTALFLYLFAIVLFSGAIARGIDTDWGAILIHKVPIEITEYQFAEGKIYRPITAQSLNERPAILLINALNPDNEALSSLASELARRGFVALSIDLSIQGNSVDPDQNNFNEILSAGFRFLKSQSFVLKDYIGLVAYSIPALEPSTEKFIQENFQSIVFIASTPNLLSDYQDVENGPYLLEINSPLDEYRNYRVDQTASPDGKFYAIHLFAPIDSKVISQTLNRFHQTLKISNDAPLWFDADKQLSGVREISLSIGFIALLFILVPLSQMISKIPHIKLSSHFASKGKNPKSFSFLERILYAFCSFLLLLISYWIFFRFTQKTENQINFSDGIVLWAGISSFIMLISKIVVKKGNIREQRLKFYDLILSLLQGILVCLIFYGIVWIFSRVFMIEFRFIAPGLHPFSDINQMRLSLYFLIFCLFFWLHATFSEQKYFASNYFISSGAFLLFLAVQFLPVLFGGTPGLEFLTGYFSAVAGLPSVTNDPFFTLCLGAITDTVISSFIIFSLLLTIQNQMKRTINNNAISAIICGCVCSWFLYNGTIII